MSEPFEFYDASAPAAPATSGSRDALRELGRTSAEAALRRALDDVDELVAEMSARDRDTGVPPELVAVLEELTGADDAPITYASLHRRVRAGTTTWDAFWAAPTEEADGMRLVADVMRTSQRRLAEALAGLPDHPARPR